MDLRAHLVAPRRTDKDRTRADPLTRLERLECKVAARNHTIKLRSGLSIAIRCASTTNWHISGTVLGIRLT